MTPFALHLLIAAMIGAALLYRAGRASGQPLRWLDAGLGVLVGAIIGARLAHIGLELPYFSANPGQILALNGGGLAWQGAVVGGMIGGALIGRLRGVSFRALTDVFAIIVPILAAFTWVGCGVSACAYGAEIRTLADYPAWLTVESPDVYGLIAPRLNLPLMGILLSALVLIGVLLLRRAPGYRLWIALALFSAGMFGIDYLRGDYVPMWWGMRADQVLDLGILGLGLALVAVYLSRKNLRNT